MTPVCVLALGAVELWDSEKPIPVGGLRQQKLLALLILNVNRTVSVEQLIDELWDDPPGSVRQQIHNAISKLRRTLSMLAIKPRIHTTKVGYRLDMPERHIDLYEFRRLVRTAESSGEPTEAADHLRSALELWRGDPFLGLDSSAITTGATKLLEERLKAVESLTALRLRTGESGAAVGELKQEVATNPLCEELRAYLMVALQASGRQADALSVYEEGRRLLADEVGLDPDRRLQRLQAEILNGVDDAARLVASDDRAQPEPVTAPVNEPVRCYLPNTPADFTGRVAELRRLHDQTRQESSSALVISVIDGMGGVGKTTLAVRFGHEVADLYSDGQYFIDLRGFTSDVRPVTPAHALDSLLQDSGVPAEMIPPAVEGRTALWRSRLAGKRALVVLDNAVDSAQVRPLLPGTAGSLAVITSRRKLTTLEGTAPLSLDVLPSADAVAMFARIAGVNRVAPEPEAVVQAVELCGRLPLAIRTAAARLRDRHGWTVADLVARLDDQQRRGKVLTADDQEVMAVLKVSYHYLAPEQQRLFRLLSLHSGMNFDARSAATLADIGLADAEAMLDALFDDNLLRQDCTGRYYFHDLIWDCAHELRDENESRHRPPAAGGGQEGDAGAGAVRAVPHVTLRRRIVAGRGRGNQVGGAAGAEPVFDTGEQWCGEGCPR